MNLSVKELKELKKHMDIARKKYEEDPNMDNEYVLKLTTNNYEEFIKDSLINYKEKESK